MRNHCILFAFLLLLNERGQELSCTQPRVQAPRAECCGIQQAKNSPITPAEGLSSAPKVSWLAYGWLEDSEKDLATPRCCSFVRKLKQAQSS